MQLKVTPRAGVWIETRHNPLTRQSQKVTPRAGVWIETLKNSGNRLFRGSLPARECGLKPVIAPDGRYRLSHSPRGSVD